MNAYYHHRLHNAFICSVRAASPCCVVQLHHGHARLGGQPLEPLAHVVGEPWPPIRLAEHQVVVLPRAGRCGHLGLAVAQPAYRMDAGLVAAMTPAERFAERRKRRQKPWLAKLEPVRPGPVVRHLNLTRYPGPKPPPFARRGADGYGRRRVRGIPQPERLSTPHLRGVAPTADARPPATARQAPIPAPCASPQAVRVLGTAKGIINETGWRSRLPPADLPRMVPPWPACQK
jgi:hypothetical protein